MIVLEFNERPPSVNGSHGNHHARAATARKWREFGRLAYLNERNAGKAPKSCQAVTVAAQQLSRNRAGLQDLGNCLLAVKAVVDGCVDAGMLPDDKPDHLRALTFLPPDICGRDGLRVTIEEVA